MSEITIKRAEPSAHWYNRDGTSCHTVKDAQGRDRPTNLRDARKFGLFPSVSSIKGIVASDTLNTWIVNQAILAALTLPRKEMETDQLFAERVVVDMEKQRNDAAAWGTRIHTAIENYVSAGAFSPTDDAAAPYCAGFVRWFESNISEVIATEKTVVSQSLGYAGRADLFAVHRLFGLCVIDFKSKAIRDGQKPVYPEWGMQLAAYARAFGEGDHGAAPASLNGQMPTLISVVIDSAIPNAEAVVHVWENRAECLAGFLGALAVWKYLKNYEPTAAPPDPKPSKVKRIATNAPEVRPGATSVPAHVDEL